MEWKARQARADPRKVSSQTRHQHEVPAEWEEGGHWRAWILEPLMLTGEGRVACHNSNRWGKLPLADLISIVFGGHAPLAVLMSQV